AALVLMVREPERTGSTPLDGRDTQEVPSLGQTLRYITQRWRGFGTLFLGSGSLSTLSALNVWNVALFQRTWHWNVGQVGQAVGILFLTAVPLGTIAGLWLTQRHMAAGRRDATARALAQGLLIAVPGFAVYALMPSAPAAIAVMFVAFVG